jgi:hypothetical protein
VPLASIALGPQRAVPLMLALLTYGAGIWASTGMFHLASDQAFRRVSKVMIAVPALLGLPLPGRAAAVGST